MICNRERVQNATENEIVPSDVQYCKKGCCPEDLIAKGDINDILTDLHPEGWGEITDFDHCDGDISITKDEETLWQALIGEIKTPLGVLPSTGQSSYGCQIWDLLGDKMDIFFLQTFEFYIRQMCQAYPEINSVVSVKVRQGNKGSIAVELTVDSIYGEFTGKERLAWTGSF